MTAQLARSRPWRATSRPSATLVSKSSGHGRSALALLRTPPRAACLAQRLCSGASRIRQARRRETPREGSRRQQATTACLRVSDCGSGRQCCHRGSLGCERTMRWLRAEPRIEPVLRSRALGPMLAAPTGAVGRFARVGSSAASRHHQCSSSFWPRPLRLWFLFGDVLRRQRHQVPKVFAQRGFGSAHVVDRQSRRRSAELELEKEGVGSVPGIRFFFCLNCPSESTRNLARRISANQVRTWTWREVESRHILISSRPRPTVGGGLSGETLGVLRAQLGAPTDGGRCSHR
jgi:hypothetical protein